MEYYSAIKRNKLSIHTATWMALMGIMMSEKKEANLRKVHAVDSIYIIFSK